MANRPVGTVSLSVAALALLVGCSSSPQYSAPQSFTVGNSAVAQLVQEAVGGDRFAAPIEGPAIVTCTGRTTCTISYTVRDATNTVFHKEIAADMQLFLPTAPMWKALFADPQFQSGTVTVRGPVNTSESHGETAIYFTLTCDRADAAKIDWAPWTVMTSVPSATTSLRLKAYLTAPNPRRRDPSNVHVGQDVPDRQQMGSWGRAPL
jgi:hypothetical protein